MQEGSSMLIIEKLKPIWLILIFGIIISNFMLYQTTIGAAILPEQSQYVVLGSMLDMIIVLPLAIMLYRNNFSVKTTIILAASGCIAIRFLIPASLLEPYESITWIGIGIEGIIIVFELALIITFVRYLPKIMKEVKQSQLPTLFSFAQSLAHYVNSKNMTFADTIEYVIRKFCSYFSGFTTQIHLGGAEQGKLVFVSMEFKNGEHIKNYPIPLNEYGFRFSGSDHEQIFRSMIKCSEQHPTISYDEMAAALIQKSNDELIAFTYNVIAEVMKENVDKSKEQQTVGGNIDIVQITKDDTVWVRRDGQDIVK